MPTSIEENKAQMRQVETPLNKSGGVMATSRSPHNTKGSTTKLPEPLGIHGAPNYDRHKK